MRIKINVQIFAIIFLLIITKQIEIYVWLMLFALIHELSHMFVGILLKLKPQTLEIQPFGIGIIFETFEKSEYKKIIIALAGPIINFIIAIVFSFINIKSQSLIVNSNLLLGIFNLIPVYPLDGGRILKSVIRLKNESEITEDVIHKISNILMICITLFLCIIIFIYKNIGLLLILAYLWIVVMKENNRYILKKRIYKIIKKST